MTGTDDKLGNNGDPLERALGLFGKEWGEASTPSDFLEKFEARLRGIPVRPERNIVRFPWRMRGKQRFLAVGAVAASLLAVLWFYGSPTGPAGALLYREGEVDFTRTGAPSGTLISGTTVRTEEEGRCMLALDNNRINLFLDEKTRVKIVSADMIRLNEGEIWVRVETDSGYFGVLTPHGRIEVHGTTFGIAVSEGQTDVVISAGEVRVVKGDFQRKLTPGEGARILEGDEKPSFYRTDRKVTPDWAKEVFARASRALASSFFPSAAPPQTE